MNAGSKGTLIATGAIVAIAGGLVARSATADDDSLLRGDAYWNQALTGSGLFLLGLGMFAAGVTARTETDETVVYGPTLPPPRPPPIVVAGDFAELPDRPVVSGGLVLAQRVRTF